MKNQLSKSDKMLIDLLICDFLNNGDSRKQINEKGIRRLKQIRLQWGNDLGIINLSNKQIRELSKVNG